MAEDNEMEQFIAGMNARLDVLNKEKVQLADALIELDAQVDDLKLQGDGVTFTHPDSDEFARASQKAKRVIKSIYHD